MIFSEESMFAYKQEITLANNPNENSTALSNVIDLGASQKPYQVKRALKRNIGDGDPIPLMATMNSMDSDIKAVFSFELQTSPDNATWRTMFKGTNFTGVGYRLDLDTVPEGTDRYLKMIFNNEYLASGDVKTGKKVTVTAAIGTYQPTNLRGL